nr:hypothetical protein [Tanacetum cinerariifolium]
VVCRVEDGDDGGPSGVVKVTRDVGEVVVGCPAAAAMVVWQCGDGYGGGVRATRRGRWW